jgi:methylaspartate mutase sigma subunit
MLIHDSLSRVNTGFSRVNAGPVAVGSPEAGHADGELGYRWPAGPGSSPATPTGRSASGGLTVIVTSVASDSHNWNLVYLQLLLEELGHGVVNLGPCVPDELLLAECLQGRPDLVVVSSVNGHGFFDGMRLIGRLRAQPELATTTTVIGGKLGIAGPGGSRSRDELKGAGFDEVFEEDRDISEFYSFVGKLPRGVRR